MAQLPPRGELAKAVRHLLRILVHLRPLRSLRDAQLLDPHGPGALSERQRQKRAGAGEADWGNSTQTRPQIRQGPATSSARAHPQRLRNDLKVVFKRTK